MRCAYVGYRDFGDKGQSNEHFDLMDFTTNLEAVKSMISQSKAFGGGDFAEDVVGALD